MLRTHRQQKMRLKKEQKYEQLLLTNVATAIAADVDDDYTRPQE